MCCSKVSILAVLDNIYWIFARLFQTFWITTYFQPCWLGPKSWKKLLEKENIHLSLQFRLNHELTFAIFFFFWNLKKVTMQVYGLRALYFWIMRHPTVHLYHFNIRCHSDFYAKYNTKNNLKVVIFFWF